MLAWTWVPNPVLRSILMWSSPFAQSPISNYPYSLARQGFLLPSTTALSLIAKGVHQVLTLCCPQQALDLIGNSDELWVPDEINKVLAVWDLSCILCGVILCVRSLMFVLSVCVCMWWEETLFSWLLLIYLHFNFPSLYPHHPSFHQLQRAMLRSRRSQVFWERPYGFN